MNFATRLLVSGEIGPGFERWVAIPANWPFPGYLVNRTT